jgi:hypothetical protein
MEDLVEVKQEVKETNSEEVYAKARAEAEVKELSAIAQDPQKTIQAKLAQKLAKEIEQSEKVDKKVSDTTQKLVNKGLEEQQNKVETDVTKSENEKFEASFQKNKDEYIHHGINHKVDKRWKERMILFINDIWFVIWAVISGFTIVPVSTFTKRVKALKGLTKFVAVVVGCIFSLMYLAVFALLVYLAIKGIRAKFLK